MTEPRLPHQAPQRINLDSEMDFQKIYMDQDEETVFILAKHVFDCDQHKLCL